MPGIIVKPRSRLLHGHDWIFASEILKTFGSPQAGDLVSIKDGRDKFLGTGTYNPASPIPVRRFSRRKQCLDADFFRRRIIQSRAYRESLGLGDSARPARIVWSESDRLPGVIVDRYGPHAVLQTLTPAMDQHKKLLASLLQEIMGVTWVWERNDSHGRSTEGLPLETGLLADASGEQSPPRPEWEVSVNGVVFVIDFLKGHKTGLYLDQLATQSQVAAWAAGREVLDCFSNVGGFALACARAGAKSVLAVESGEEAVEQLSRNATRNGWEIRSPLEAEVDITEGEGTVGFRCVRRDVFEFLRRAERRPPRWDLIVLDPPSFTRTAGQKGGALRGYRELHLRAARLLQPGGLLATFSCSHHVGREEFLQTVVEGFWEAGKTVRLREEYGQSPDHPVLPHLPETRYLHGVLVEMLPGH